MTEPPHALALGGRPTASYRAEGTLVMPRYELLLAGIIAATTLAAGGCRSCSSCHDYDPPVANCDCDAYGTHRSGSACGGCANGSCSNCNGGGYVEGDYVEGEYSNSGYPTDGSFSTEGTMSEQPMQESVGQP